jgi:NAD(P)H-hydrate repair Nnr-like enzyme with NAD(P)H-hydrate epimerase domain
MEHTFQTKQGVQFNGASSAQVNALISDLNASFGISPAQTIEAASYSMAMVVRFALGLSAAGGQVCAVARDSMAGCVALATVRHLVNAGAKAQALVLLDDPNSASLEIQRQVTTLRHLGVQIPNLDSANEIDAFTQFLGEAHNVLFGTFGGTQSGDEFVQGLTELLNEERTPVHCIEAPAGIDPDTGKAGPVPLYASSTLSLGIPYSGLYEGRDFVGRHYLCDISASAGLYEKHACTPLNGLFSDQPVIQIYPIVTE